MTDITLRQTKGAPLTHDELDQNFANLKETADLAFEASASLGGKANASAIGTDDAATNMGTTPGTILSDNGTAKQWFQESEAAIEERATFSQAGAYDEESLRGRVVDLPKSIKAAPYYAAAAGDDTDAMLALAASSDTAINLSINSPTRLSGTVLFTDKNLTIEGGGASSSKITCEGAGGIRFLSTATAETVAAQHRFSVKGLSLVQDDAQTAGNGPTAIEAEWSYTGSGSIERGVFEDLTISGGGSGKWWGTGLRLIDAPQIRMSNIKIFNQDGHQTCQSAAAIDWVRDKATNVTGLYLTNFYLGRYVDAIRVSQKDATVGAGTVEGMFVANGEIVNVAYAFHEDNANLAGYYFDSIGITNIHWNASRAGFKSGRTRGLSISNSHLFHQNFGDSNPAPLEAGVNVLLQLDGFRFYGNQLTRYDTVTADVPAFLLPDAASLNWARIEGNMIANWLYVANVQSGGALTELAAKLFLGSNTLVATPYLADYGFRGDKSVVGANVTAATGTVIDFGHTFNGAPAVSLICRNAYVTNYRADSVSATGFTLVHDGAGSQSFSWTAVGN